MQRFKISVMLLLAGLCGATLALECVLLHQEHARAAKSCAALGERQRERERLLRQSPAPSTENEEALVAAVAEASRAVAALRDEIGGRAASAPVGSVEAYFELKRLVDEMRRRSAAAQVAVKTAERFGFASYAHEGPTEAVLPAVVRQHTAARHLLVSLLDARPLALLGVKRERLGAVNEDKTNVGTEDYFALPPEHSLRQSGVLDTDAFQLEFTGPTAVLRQFLNTLAGSSQAVVVRTVEVEPVRVSSASAGRANDPLEAAQWQQVSKFTVTLEIPVLADAGGSP